VNTDKYMLESRMRSKGGRLTTSFLEQSQSITGNINSVV